jgi:NAD(P)-dependent dehydrogenase (short-subunit alcohol dehydrogenase family)
VNAASAGAGRAVLITGCSSGIGRAVAAGLRARGYRVLASARRPEDVTALAAEGFESLRLDVADPDSVALAAAEVLDRTEHRVFGLFNNAGYGQPGAVEDLSLAALRAQFETNLFGPHALTARLLPAMRQRGEGRILQNSSVLGRVALRYRGAYNASKYALEGLSDTLRLELAGTGVWVSLIEPGPIRTRFRENSHAAYVRHIRPEGSAHREAYRGLERRLVAPGPVAPFTLGPEAVLKAVVHALESARPRPRYPVTFPTRLFGALRRLLPDRLLDRVLLHVSRGEA